MFLSMIPLVLIILLIAGGARQCDLSPGGPTTGEVPEYDVDSALQMRANTESFPVRNPALPDAWQSNSGGAQLLEDDQKVVEVGYITDIDDPKSYLRLAQTDADIEVLLESQSDGKPAFDGETEVAGTTWQVYTADNGEPLWVTALPGVNVSITGSGTEGEFTVLAEAVQQAEPLPDRRTEARTGTDAQD